MGAYLLCKNLREIAGTGNWIEQKGGLMVKGQLWDMRDVVFSFTTLGVLFVSYVGCIFKLFTILCVHTFIYTEQK